MGLGVTNLGVSSFDVVECSLGQLDELRIADSVYRGGSRLSGQGLHLKHKAGELDPTGDVLSQ